MFRPPVADPDPDPEWAGRRKRKKLPALLVTGTGTKNYFLLSSLSILKGEVVPVPEPVPIHGNFFG
jgi:hypothetical protein